MTAPPAPGVDATAVLLDIEGEARHAADHDIFRFVAVNQTRRLVAYRQAILFAAVPGDARRPLRVEAVSNVAAIDRNAPFIRWLEAVAGHLDGPSAAPRALNASHLPPALRSEWADFVLPSGLWIPLPTPDGDRAGALWLSREEPWAEAEVLLAGRLGDTFGHARQALDTRPAWRRRRSGARPPWWRRLLPWGVAAGLLAGLAVPVPQSALAPAEVVARDPLVVAAPLEGVIGTFAVAPNDTVKAGQLLFSIEDEPVRARRDIAEKSLAVAEAELRKAVQSSFADERSKMEVAILRGRLRLRAAELAHAEEALARADVRAPRGGIAVFTDVNDWLGRPVRTGERVLTIADPRETEIRADLPVADAIALDPGTPVTVFLAADPLTPLEAVLTHASYEARMNDQNVLAYRVRARFTAPEQAPRVGLKGTAKLRGERVPLALYLFRRPLATVRQVLGV